MLCLSGNYSAAPKALIHIFMLDMLLISFNPAAIRHCYTYIKRGHKTKEYDLMVICDFGWMCDTKLRRCTIVTVRVML